MARMAHRLQILRVNEKPFSARGVRVMERAKNFIHQERGKTMLEKFEKGLFTLVFSSAVLLFSSPFALAAEALPAGGESYTKVLFAVGAMIAAGFAIGVGAVGAGLGIGTAASGACSAVGRNPGVQGKIMMTMLVGMAMAESIAIYALVVSLVLLYANPFMKYFLVG
jgi:F-type H+-transporting ATPase subunit c